MQLTVITMSTLIVLIVTLAFSAGALGHGMVMDPPNRSSMWRFFPGFPINYDDDGNYCGGIDVQWEINHGRCGVCGDSYNDPTPRDNENTGKYGTGKVAKTYQQGSVITISVLLTTNHKGFFNFSLCDLPDVTKPETEDCFQGLKLADGSSKYVLQSHKDGYYNVDLKLPDGKTCERCVLRWHYNAGNNWGQCEDGHWDEGCGEQETFKSCSDIAIV